MDQQQPTGDQIIILTEYDSVLLAHDRLTPSQAAAVQREYSRELTLTLLFAEGGVWRLTAHGYIGVLRVGGLLVEIRPRTSIENLYKLLHYAYGIQVRLQGEQTTQQPIIGLLSGLALQLATAVQRRCRRGLYHRYDLRHERLPYVRGRLMVREMHASAAVASVPVEYEAFSVDVAHNQLLRYALHVVLRTGLVDDPQVRRAYRLLQGQVSLRPFSGQSALLDYDRLNEDYRSMHAICRLLIDALAPGAAIGERQSVPFLIDMGLLFERAVAGWLRQHMPAEYALRIQERSAVGDGNIQIVADLVIVDSRSDRIYAVLDTKYKQAISNQDVYQVAFYANASNSRQAILVYPQPPAQPLDTTVGDVTLRALTFDLSMTIENAGQAFLQSLFR